MDSDDSYLDEYEYYNEDDEEEEEVGYAGTYPGTYCGFPPSFLFPQKYSLPRFITPEEAERNARELLQAEEREKEKADKKRLKKKRQKDRKRQQKLQEAQSETSQSEERTVTPDNNNSNNGGRKEEADGDEDPPRPDSSQSASDEDLDLRSTFVRQAQRKVETKAERRGKERPPQTKERPPQPGAPPPPPPQSDINILESYKIQESLDLANMGNNMAGEGRFLEALHYYTEAIKLHPSEFRFLGNRSYVYERLGQYEAAVRDAESALQIQPHFLKGHFRRGKALKGLQRYAEAVASFQAVLSCDTNHVEAAAEIVQCQQKIKETMTSTRVKILSSAPLSPPATPPAGVPGQTSKVFVPRNIYNTKCDPKKEAGVTPHSKFYPIWVGNVTNKITENILREKFQPFGLIHSVRILYGRTCAFINFTSRKSAEDAFRSLQGVTVEGTTFVLQLRNPEHSAAPRAPGPGGAGK